MDLWDLVFSQLCAWLMHPGYQREGAKVPSLQELCKLTDLIVDARLKHRGT